MSLIFLYLNGDRGLEVLKVLVSSGYNTIEVFSKIDISVVNKFCINNNLNFNIVSDVNSKKHISFLKTKKPNLSIVAGFSQIFNSEVINIPTLGTINLHGGPLPNYRGGSPLNWQIINGEKKIGVSLIIMNEGIDTGDIISTKYFSLSLNQDISHAHKFANKLFSKMVLEFLEKTKNNSINLIKQIKPEGGYWHQRQDFDGEINWKLMNAHKVHNLVRALTFPYKGAYTYYNGFKMRILKTNILKENYFGNPGRIIKMKDKKIIVICSDKGISIVKYAFEDFKGELLNGHYLSTN